MQHFKRYFLWYTILPLLILALAASYYRFMISYDYEVVFEGYCDPYTDSCFEYCEDEACTEPFHYTWFTRNAAELRRACGDLSILECTEAEVCGSDEVNCHAAYCDPNVDTCESLGLDDKPFELEFEELLQTENI